MSQATKVRKLAKMVIAQTGGGRALVQFLLNVAEGQIEGSTVRDQLEATKILLDRGWGKAPLQIDVSGQVNHVIGGHVDVSKLSSDELEMLRKTLRRAVVAELPAPTEEDLEEADVIEE